MHRNICNKMPVHTVLRSREMRFFHMLTATALASLLLTGCGTLAPETVRPALPVPTSYPAAGTEASVLPT